METSPAQNHSVRNRLIFMILSGLVVIAVGGLLALEGISKSTRAPERPSRVVEQDASSLFDGMRVAINIADSVINAEVVESYPARVRGLSGRASLPSGEGLLFVFPTIESHGIVMREMFFSIDILWISDSFEVVHIEQDAAPETYPEVFRSTVPARYVLEVPAGTVAANGIGSGDKVEIVIEGQAAGESNEFVDEW